MARRFGDEDREVMKRLVVALATNHVHEHGDRTTVSVHQLQLNLHDGALHVEQRQPVRLMVDLAAHGQQVLKALPEELSGFVADAVRKQLVDPAYPSACIRDE